MSSCFWEKGRVVLSLKRLPLVKEIPLLGEMSAKRTKGSAASARRAQTDKKLRDCTKLFERSEYLNYIS